LSKKYARPHKTKNRIITIYWELKAGLEPIGGCHILLHDDKNPAGSKDIGSIRLVGPDFHGQRSLIGAVFIHAQCVNQIRCALFPLKKFSRVSFARGAQRIKKDPLKYKKALEN
jgi:hypothetical protein